MKECKRHKWRVGSGIGGLKNKKIVKVALNIWCENCDKKIKAKYESHNPINLNIKAIRKKIYKRKDSASIIRREGK